MKTQKNKNKNKKETDEDVRERRGRVMAGEDRVLKNDAIVIVLNFVILSRFFIYPFLVGRFVLNDT